MMEVTSPMVTTPSKSTSAAPMLMGKALFLLFKNECGCHPINPLNSPTRQQAHGSPLIPDADKINLLILENLFNFVACY